MNKFILKIKRFFCSHKDIRYWESEKEIVQGRKYRVYKMSCMKCGLDYEIRKRL